MTWATAMSRFDAPAMEFGVVEVTNAFVTPFARGRLRTQHGPHRWTRGAVHDDRGALVRASQRHWDGDAHTPIAADPDRVAVPRRAPRLSGTWVYAGHWSNHFGHFLLETLPNLWPPPEEQAAGVSGVLVHRPVRTRLAPSEDRAPLEHADLSPWQHDLLELAGYGDSEVRIVHGGGARVQRLLVPPRPVLLKRWAQRPAVELWRRVSDAVPGRGGHPRVYLSRSQFHACEQGAGRARVDPAWQEHLDATFAAAGFEVVYPECLTITEQIELVRGVQVLAGLSGSALHLSAFADPGTRVLVLGDQRSPRRPIPAQTMVDAACGHRTAFVPNEGRRELSAALDELDR